MNRSHLINWLAIGLIVLFVGVLLAAVIVPRLIGSRTGSGILLAATPTPDIPGQELMFAPDGAVITTEPVGDIPAQTRVKVVGTTSGSQGWLFQIRTLDGQHVAAARLDQLMLDPALDPNAPTPAPLYADPAYASECYPLVLIEAIPSDDVYMEGEPAMLEVGTRVRVASIESFQYIEGEGWGYRYRIMAYPGDNVIPNPPTPMSSVVMSATAREDQLAPAPDVQIDPDAPTPTSPYPVNTYPNGFITTEDLGEKIPLGTRLSIELAYLACDHWLYAITTETGVHATLSETQITYAPDITPGAPTPTITVVIARTIGDPTTSLYEQPVLDPDTVIAEVLPGTELTVHGRGSGSSEGWFIVFWLDAGGHAAWVQASQVTIEGDASRLPEIIQATLQAEP